LNEINDSLKMCNFPDMSDGLCSDNVWEMGFFNYGKIKVCVILESHAM
jgi:hypothetical protein